MKIAFIIPAYIPALSFGGPVSVLRDLVRILRIRGYEITIYTTNAINTKRFTSQLTQEYIEGILVKRYRVLFKISGYWVTPLMFKDLMKDDIDIIHVHCARSFQLDLAYLVSKLRGKPLIITAHGALSTYREMGSKLRFLYHLQNTILTFSLRQANKLTALNKAEFEQYRNLGVSDDNIVVIPNGIDLSEYTDMPSKGEFKKNFNIPKDKKIILYVGRIHRMKGIDSMIQALAHLINNMKCKDILLVLVGPDDGYLTEAKFLSTSLNISDSVLFTGFISDEDKFNAFIDAKLFVTPSFSGFPVTFLEACVSGTPIITTTLGDTLEWMDGSVGYVTSPTYIDLAKAIYRIINDDELYEEFSRNCKEIVKSEFSIDKVVDRIEHIYKEVIYR